MTLLLSEVTFVNDFFYIDTPNGNTLILNKVEESFSLSDNAEETTEVNCININIVDSDGNYVKCPSVIGIEGKYTKIDTEYKEYLGEVLTSGNMEYCTMTVYES